MNKSISRGKTWLDLLSRGGTPYMPSIDSVQAVEKDGMIYIAVVPDPNNHYPRARTGEVGLLEGWTLAKTINKIVEEDRSKQQKRPIIAIVDVTSQAYGRREEAFGIHMALAGSVAAYAKARMQGHPIVSLIVGKAMSGAFLAHGYQANRILALDDPKVLIHAMGKESAARITLRSVDELDKFASKVPPMAYDIKHYAELGLLEELLKVTSADNPTQEDEKFVINAISKALEKAKEADTTLDNRLGSPNRKATSEVMRLIKANW